MMMDELELLKKDWQKKEEHHPKLSFDEIYKMIWKKSSSIVKWIFYISIAEFLFWIAISLVPIENENFNGNGADYFETISMILNIVSFGIILFFVVKFYLNYRSINTTDSAQTLMKKILSVRKTVMQYVWFNLIIFAVSMILFIVGVLMYDPEGFGISESVSSADNQMVIWILIIGAFVLITLLIAFLLWLFYKLIYGILLKQLNANYKELKKLEL